MDFIFGTITPGSKYQKHWHAVMASNEFYILPKMEKNSNVRDFKVNTLTDFYLCIDTVSE